MVKSGVAPQLLHNKMFLCLGIPWHHEFSLEILSIVFCGCGIDLLIGSLID